MASPLLETKLHIPRQRRGLVARPRLSERLGRRAESALTLVSAPAGFGKTTLLTEWLAAAPADARSAAWLSLDQRDNDPALFWTYLITALQRAAPGVGAGALSLLKSPQPQMEAVLATLLNELRGQQLNRWEQASGTSKHAQTSMHECHTAWWACECGPAC